MIRAFVVTQLVFVAPAYAGGAVWILLAIASEKHRLSSGLFIMDKAFADHFATEWIDSWNSHDLERILSHYEEDFEMSSPVIIQVTGEPSGTLQGKTAVRAYWKKALTLIPDLRFELLSVLVGVDSITLYYKGAGGRLAAEVFHFGPSRKVMRAFAHYAI